MWATAIVWAAVTITTILGGWAYNSGRDLTDEQTQAEWCAANSNSNDGGVRQLHAKYCSSI